MGSIQLGEIEETRILQRFRLIISRTQSGHESLSVGCWLAQTEPSAVTIQDVLDNVRRGGGVRR